MAGDNHKIDNNKNDNKTKVLSVQLGKTLCLTKVPITETEESTQVRGAGFRSPHSPEAFPHARTQ